MRAWETAVIGEEGTTAALAGLAAVYFLRRHARESLPARRAAALALALSTAGASLVAAHGVAVALGGERTSATSLLVGLPALAGQGLLALLALRRGRNAKR